MKTEDIDRKIGMPDIDMEWAKFDKEVIDAYEEKIRKLEEDNQALRDSIMNFQTSDVVDDE